MGGGGGGYSYPIMLCNISQNGADTWGGVPCQVQPGGGGTLPGLAGGVPCPGVPCQGGTQVGTPPPPRPVLKVKVLDLSQNLWSK